MPRLSIEQQRDVEPAAGTSILPPGGRYLVTGGTGSFGHAMISRLLQTSPAEIRVLSRDEAKQEAMRQRIRDERIRYYVGDVRCFDTVLKATRHVEYVFHAAALKQVPSCEFFPLEAVRTNILGSVNVADACERNNVARLVFLSTDKAVYPVNAMGMTKALMEKIAQAHSRSTAGTTTVCCVRYGNVMYSRGSVIPLLVKQVRNGHAMTITHPGMTRFLMSVADAVQLVEHAFRHGQAGDTFILKAPACSIGDLATAIANLFQAPPKWEVIGVRHGEKLSETLIGREELARAQDLGDFFRVSIDARDMHYADHIDDDHTLEYTGDYNSDTAPRLDVPSIEALLHALPEIQDQLDPTLRLAVAA